MNAPTITAIDLPAQFAKTFADSAVVSVTTDLRHFDPFGRIVGAGFAVVTRDAAFGPFETLDATTQFIAEMEQSA